MQDLQSGQIDLLCEIIVTAIPQIEAKTVKPLANLSPVRSPLLPSLPTAVEGGLAKVQAYTWTAVYLPKGVPQAIVEKLRSATVAAMETPAVAREARQARRDDRSARSAHAGRACSLHQERTRKMEGSRRREWRSRVVDDRPDCVCSDMSIRMTPLIHHQRRCSFVRDAHHVDVPCDRGNRDRYADDVQKGQKAFQPGSPGDEAVHPDDRYADHDADHHVVEHEDPVGDRRRVGVELRQRRDTARPPTAAP